MRRYDNQTFKMRKSKALNAWKNQKHIKADTRTVKTVEPCTSTMTDNIEFLKTHKKPWDVIEQKWKDTHQVRIRDIKDNNIKLETTTAKFPLITNMELGSLMVRINTNTSILSQCILPHIKHRSQLTSRKCLASRLKITDF